VPPVSLPIATIDTSVFISLQSAGILGAISVLFERVLVPTTVRAELEDGGDRNLAALIAINEFAIFEHCDDYDAALVKWLLDTRKSLKLGRDQGEADAVIQAAQHGANMVLVEDPLGRKWANNHGKECHGAIWVCCELRRTGYLNELRSRYIQMIRSGQRQPLKELNKSLVEFGEPPFTDEEYREYMLVL
jgi:predicted nucleic acid-binding protein